MHESVCGTQRVPYTNNEIKSIFRNALKNQFSRDNLVVKNNCITREDVLVFAEKKGEKYVFKEDFCENGVLVEGRLQDFYRREKIKFSFFNQKVV